MLRWTRFNIISVVLGFAFLYLPIVLLVVFSFNESKLVTVGGGFSTKWYGALFADPREIGVGGEVGVGKAHGGRLPQDVARFGEALQ